MSDLPGNPYAMDSRNPNITKDMTASLALAYEQRTANLIAMYADGATGPVHGVDYANLLDQIKERLGLA